MTDSLTKTKLPKSACGMEDMDVCSVYGRFSCELRALAKMVNQEFGSGDMAVTGFRNISCANRSPLFERGRFYEEYSARRNERLKRKKGETGVAKKPVYDLGVKVESAKRETKRFESSRKTVSSSKPFTERREPSPRYWLRSAASKGNKKPSVPVSIDKSAGTRTKKAGGRRARKT